jgi:hypothetical protein
MTNMSAFFESVPKFTKTLASIGGGGSAGFLVATAIKIFFPDLPILKDLQDFYSLFITLGVALERFINFFLYVLLPRGARLLLVDIPNFSKALKCWDTLTPADKQVLLNALFYTMLYWTVPKTEPQEFACVGKAVQAPLQLQASVTQQVEQLEGSAAEKRNPAKCSP